MPHALETERLVLRPFTEADIEVAYRLFEQDEEVYRFDPGSPRTLEQRAAIVRRHMAQNEENGEGTLAVTLKSNGALIGQAGLQLYVLPWQPFATPEVELYYKLGRAHWGEGYALEACRALVDFAFADMRLLRIVTITQPDNTHSMRLLKRLGFSIGPAPDAWQPSVLGISGQSPRRAAGVTRQHGDIRTHAPVCPACLSAARRPSIYLRISWGRSLTVPRLARAPARLAYETGSSVFG